MKENDTQTRKQAFSKKITDILNYGALNLAMGIGYRTGLFDAMDILETPQPVSIIAEKAGLDARYVKEWLSITVCGGIVEITTAQDGTNLFFLPEEHADFITRRSGNSNLGVYTQEIPLLTKCAMASVLDGFCTGKGVSYENYPEFQAFMAELADAKHRRTLVDIFLESVDGGKMVEELKKGIRVCDLGCGEGVAVNLMADAFPASRFTGLDISPEALQKAKNEANALKIANVEFLRLDAASLQNRRDLKSSFDYVTAFDAVHDQSHPLDALKGVFHILRPGGAFSMIDIAAESNPAGNTDHPMGPFLYTVSLMHCMPVGLVDDGTGLGMMWGRQKAVEMLNRAGFDDVNVLEIPEDSFNLHFFCKKTLIGD